MATRCKARILSMTSHIRSTADGDREGVTVRFGGHCDPGDPDSNQFTKATPSLNFEMYVTNLPAIDGWKIGDVFYVDFSKIA